jgi:hypothetical protein
VLSFPSGGSMHGPNRVQDTILDDAGVVEKTLFRCEDQLGSLIGVYRSPWSCSHPY